MIVAQLLVALLSVGDNYSKQFVHSIYNLGVAPNSTRPKSYCALLETFLMNILSLLRSRDTLSIY